MHLLFTVPNLPLYFVHGKSHRKLMVNAVLSMNWMRRKQIHDMFMNQLDCKLASIDPIAKANGDHYIIKFGWYEDKTTANMDLDGFGYIQKIVIDAIAKKMSINDSYHNIIKVECGYYGTRDQEHLDVQVFKTSNIICPISKEKQIKEIMLAEGIDADKINAILANMNEKDLI